MKFNLNFKIKIVTEYLSGIGSTTLARKYAIANEDTVLIWINRFKKFGNGNAVLSGMGSQD